MAPVVAALKRRGTEFDTRVCVTAQHREMLDQVLEFFDIEPEIDLDLMKEDQSPSQVTCSVLGAMARVLGDEPPDLVLVHGDTTTTMAAALAAFYRKIPVGHVEAGLRTGDRYYPFPEEMNRVLADALSTLHFAPTATAKSNLIAAGVDPNGIYVTGNTVIDALLAVASDPRASDPDLPTEGRLVLVTAHRRENFGRPLEDICHALRAVVDRFGDVHVVYPVHLNPNVQSVARSILAGHERIHLVDPLPYAQFVRAMTRAYIVVTDSGGLQEEAPSLGKPVLVLRGETERPEAVEAGTVRIIGTDAGDIEREIVRLLTDEDAYRSMAAAVNPYGDGRASERIAGYLRAHFGFGGASVPPEFVPAE